MSRLREALEKNKFAVTSELCPPHGTNVAEFVATARKLSNEVLAFNVTDNQRAMMKLSSLVASHLLVREGLEPVWQLACRDRNRLALQSDLLGSHSLGIKNVLALTGDPVRVGDHQDAKAVFDWNSFELLRLIWKLNRGFDHNGNPLSGKTDIYPGAAIDPTHGNVDLQIKRLEKKLEAGAQFFQTQAVFSLKDLERFMKKAEPFKPKILVGVLYMWSAKNVNFLNKYVPGLNIPKEIKAELEKSSAPEQTGLEIAARMIKEYSALCHGVHIMAIKREEKVADILKIYRQL